MSRYLDLDDCKLDAVFRTDPECVIHTSYRSNRSRRIRKVAVVEAWAYQKDLGGGGFGRVHLEKLLESSEAQPTYRYRAVKMLYKNDMAKSKIDFRKELTALNKFSKSKFATNFVEFIGWYENEENIFIAMEYIEQGTLDQYISAEMVEEDAQVISLQLLEGLSVLHEQGFTHRDLKPENIFVVEKVPQWWVKLGDFGISKRVSKNETELKTIIGTLIYLAPEVVPANLYTNAVDMWSFACVAYEMMALQVPFASRLDLENFCQGGLFPVEPLFSRTSSTGIEFIKSVLEPRPADRPSAKDAMKAEWLLAVHQQLAASYPDEILDYRSDQPVFREGKGKNSHAGQSNSFPSNDGISSAQSNLSVLQPYTWVSRPTTNINNSVKPTEMPQKDRYRDKDNSKDSNIAGPSSTADLPNRNQRSSALPRRDRHETTSGSPDDLSGEHNPRAIDQKDYIGMNRGRDSRSTSYDLGTGKKNHTWDGAGMSPESTSTPESTPVTVNQLGVHFDPSRAPKLPVRKPVPGRKSYATAPNPVLPTESPGAESRETLTNLGFHLPPLQPDVVKRAVIKLHTCEVRKQWYKIWAEVSLETSEGWKMHSIDGHRVENEIADAYGAYTNWNCSWGGGVGFFGPLPISSLAIKLFYKADGMSLKASLGDIGQPELRLGDFMAVEPGDHESVTRTIGQYIKLQFDINIITVDRSLLKDTQGRSLPEGWIRTEDEKGRLVYKNLDDGRVAWYNPSDTVPIKSTVRYPWLARTNSSADQNPGPSKPKVQQPQRRKCETQ